MSNPLLALLNASSSAAPGSASSAAAPSSSPEIERHRDSTDRGQQQQATSADLLAQITSPPARSPPATVPRGTPGGDNANDLLRALLSPRGGLGPTQAAVPLSGVSPSPYAQQPQTQPQQPPTTQGAASSPLSPPLPASAQTSAADLLALLSSGKAVSPPAPRESPSLAAFGSDVTRSENASDRNAISPPTTTSRERAPSQARNSPRPPSSQRQIKKSARAPVPTMFDFASPFDLLDQRSNGTSDGHASLGETPNVGYTQGVKQAPSMASPHRRPASTLSTVSKPATETQQPSIVYEDDRNRHARRHLVGLRASSGFDDDISSGLTKHDGADGSVEYTLELLAPQPAGCSSLYPAKLEIAQISLISSTLAPPSIHATSSAKALSQWPSQLVAGLGASIIMYSMTKGRVRIIHQQTGARTLAKFGNSTPSLAVGFGATQHDGRSWWAFSTLSGNKLGLWLLSTDFGQIEVEPSLIAEYAAPASETLVHASYLSSSNNSRVVVAQSDGRVASLRVPSLKTQQRPEKLMSQADDTTIESDQTLLALCTDGQGKSIATIHSVPGSTTRYRASLHPVATSTSKARFFEVDTPRSIDVHNVSFAALTGPVQSPAQSLLVGFDNNTTLAFIDLRTGSTSAVIHLTGRDNAHFVQPCWDHTSATLLLASSLRSSVFVTQIYQQSTPALSKTSTVDNNAKTTTADSLFGATAELLSSLTPLMRECSLEESWTTFSVASAEPSTGALRIVAATAAGIQVVSLPGEALKQTFSEVPKSLMADSGSVAVADETESQTEQVRSEDAIAPGQTALTPASDTANAAEGSTPEQDKQAEHVARHVKEQKQDVLGKEFATSTQLSTLLAAMERNILDAVAAHEEESGAAIQNAEETAQAIVRRLVPKLNAAIKEAVREDLVQSVVDVVHESLPEELHKLLTRPDVNAQLTKSISSSVVQPVQRTAMDVVSRVLAPHFEEVMSELTTRVERKLDMSITGIRKDIVTEQGKALLGTEASVSELVQHVRNLASQVEHLARQNGKLEKAITEVREEQKVMSFESIRGGRSSSIPPQQISAALPPAQYSQYAERVPSSAAPRAGVPQMQASSQPPPPPPVVAPPAQPLPDVEDALLGVLSSPMLEQDASLLQRKLGMLEHAYGSARASFWDEQGGLRVSQAVILTLLHRLTKALGKPAFNPAEMAPEQCVPWIEACCIARDRADSTVAPYFDSLRREIIDGIIGAHQKFAASGRATWWSSHRLEVGILQHLQ